MKSMASCCKAAALSAVATVVLSSNVVEAQRRSGGLGRGVLIGGGLGSGRRRNNGMGSGGLVYAALSSLHFLMCRTMFTALVTALEHMHHVHDGVNSSQSTRNGHFDGCNCMLDA
jgi:hypothetical protein